MEHKRETDIEDYWLIQYQRLLESKPTSLLEKVRIFCCLTACSESECDVQWVSLCFYFLKSFVSKEKYTLAVAIVLRHEVVLS